MTDLTTRLLAEIARREGVARSAGGDTERWHPIGATGVIALDANGDWVHRPLEANVRTAQDFVTANDPATVLAYLTALREIVELHTAAPVAGDESRFYCPTESYDICAWPCPTIRIVARALGVDAQ